MVPPVPLAAGVLETDAVELGVALAEVLATVGVGETTLEVTVAEAALVAAGSEKMPQPAVTDTASTTAPTDR